MIVRGEGASKRLVGYVVAGEAVIDAETLKSALQRALPAFMVPSDLVMLAEMPRTPNGKLDRKHLPEPERIDKEHVAPQTEVERKLAAIWQAVLGVARVGLTDNFFELGGLDRIHPGGEPGARGRHPDQPQRGLPAPDAASVGARSAAAGRGADVGFTRRGEVGLTPIQAAFFQQRLPEPHHYNQAVLLDVRGSFEPAPLSLSLGHLLVHHDALRLRFREEQGSIVQWYAAPEEDPVGSVLWVRDAADGAEVERIADEAQQSLSLETGPLMRAVHMRVADGTQRLLLIIHHLAVDGVSWRLLLEDLRRVHDQIVAGQPVALPAKSSSFQRWSERLRRYADSEALESQVEYWQRALRGSRRRCGATILPRERDRRTHRR